MPTATITDPATAPAIVKWAGGKRQLLPELRASCPPQFHRYFEPFAGGAALFFALARPGSYLSDTNGDLIRLYQIVRDQVEPLIEQLTQIQAAYRSLRPDAQVKFFYEMRMHYNARTGTPLEHSARFVALNRLAFNGLYRLNAHGAFNTPFGRYTNPDIVRSGALRAAHDVLQSATVIESDYTAITAQVRESDFCYIDPPYMPASKTAQFTHYTAAGFGWDDQVALAQFVRTLAQQGVYVMASNADVPAIHDLYDEFYIRVVPVRRAINADATRRTGMTEVIITTYPVAHE